MVQGRRAEPVQQVLMGLGLVGLLVGSLLGARPGVLGMLNLIGWAAGQATFLAWNAVKSDRELAASLLGKSQWMHPGYSDVTRLHLQCRVGYRSLHIYTQRAAAELLFMCIYAQCTSHQQARLGCGSP